MDKRKEKLNKKIEVFSLMNGNENLYKHMNYAQFILYSLVI
jgi:hypothetical protein